MDFPPGVQFYEDNRLIVWRPRGLLDEKAVSDVVALLGRLENEREPFHRFSDTIAVDQVDLNYEFVIRVALYRRLLMSIVRQLSRPFSRPTQPCFITSKCTHY